MMRAWTILALLAVACSDTPEPADDTPPTDTGGQASTPSAPTPELEPGVNELTLEQVVEGETVTRTYRVHLPAEPRDSGTAPLLFAFHGAGGTGADFLAPYGPAVETGEVIGVYPDGLEESWNIEREDSKADDVAFVEAILATLEGADGIDAERPVAVGFSNGAALAQKIAMEAGLFVGMAPQGSQLLVGATPPDDAAPISVMHFHGTADDSCPYDGGVGVLGYEFMAAEDSTAAWAAHNGCAATPTEVDLDPHARLEWEDCDNGRRVVHYRMEDVGHGVPPDIDGSTFARVVEFLLEARE